MGDFGIGEFFGAMLALLYFGVVISIVVYLISLLIRLVKAVEKIANSVETCCKSKTLQPD
jgi:hypothetical protein